jgi:hypothetical protein
MEPKSKLTDVSQVLTASIISVMSKPRAAQPKNVGGENMN